MNAIVLLLAVALQANAGVSSGSGSTIESKQPDADFEYSCQVSVSETGDCTYWKYVNLDNSNVEYGSFHMVDAFNKIKWDYVAPGCNIAQPQTEVLSWGFRFVDDITIHTNIEVQLTSSMPVQSTDASSGGAIGKRPIYASNSLFWYTPGTQDSQLYKISLACEQKKWVPYKK